MEIIKITTHKYDVTFYPFSPMVFIWKDFKRIRKAHGMSTANFDHCFCCDHKFNEDEKLVVVNVKGKGNRFACQDCLKKEWEE